MTGQVAMDQKTFAWVLVQLEQMLQEMNDYGPLASLIDALECRWKEAGGDDIDLATFRQTEQQIKGC